MALNESFVPAKPGPIFLVGAGGCGMSALGHLLLDAGFEVAGSDLGSNAYVEELRARGARIFSGHAKEHLLSTQPRLVAYSSAIGDDNSELRWARARGIPLMRRAVLLAALANRRQCIGVAGMHGKTTTASLLAFALGNLHANPSYAIGALVPQLGRHGRLAAIATEAERANPFVVEADESDGTLLSFRPENAVVLNIDEEHMDHYREFDAVRAEFARFGEQVRQRLVYCADDPRLAGLYSGSRHVSFGFAAHAHYRIIASPDSFSALASPDRISNKHPRRRFEIWRGQRKLTDFSIRLAGEKNLSNAAAVVALLSEMGYPAVNIAHAIADFAGVARRQDILFACEHFKVVDDYAHHPAEISATIEALRQSHSGRVLVAFQPHRYSRTHALLSRFATCFNGADRVWVTDIYAAGETALAGISGEVLVEAIRETRQNAEYASDSGQLRARLREEMASGDLVLFLGAGDITKAANAFAAELKSEQVDITPTMCNDLSAMLSSEAKVSRNEPLAKKTTLRVGGPADLYVEPASESDLARTLAFCRENGLPITILGRGSNLLIRDGGVRGVVISLVHASFSSLDVLHDRLHCGAGVKLKLISAEARRKSLSGLEFLEGIPGTLGGALRMNAGAMGSWIFEVVESVRFMDFLGQIHERNAGEVCFEYRGCPLFKDHIALSAVLKGQATTHEVVARQMKAFSQKRWDTQPTGPTAGCIFKNPATIPAGRLIDELGLKGIRVGGAVVSDVHGNFIVNDRAATARDVLNLIEIIKERARSSRGIELETEVQILGDDSAE